MKIEVVEQPEQQCALIRETVPMTAIRDFFDRAMGAVAAAVQEQGGTFAGPPFARYWGQPSETLDVACGFPVDSAITPSGGVEPSVLPAATVYQSVHVGPYEGLPEAYEAIAARMAADGVRPGDSVWEFYVTDPSRERDPARWQTRICWPVDSVGE